MDFIVTILYLCLTLFLQCGASKEFVWSERLLGSEVQSINEFPYIVFIKNLKDPLVFTSHPCAGVIISEYWVLTAATCVKRNHEKVKVFKMSTVGLHTGFYYLVNKTIVHPNFKPIIAARPPNNIALLHVKASLFRNDTNVSAIPLGRIPDESGIRVQTVGWSSTGDLGIFSRHDIFKIGLLKLSLQTMDSGQCSKKHNKSVDKEICVFANLGKTWCSSNEGNPLITMNKRRPRLVGIGSAFTYSCNNEDLPDLFLSLSVYIDWLRKVTGLDLPLD